MAYVILRTAKLKTFGNISASASHCFRERETKNADAKKTPDNKTYGAKSVATLLAGFKKRLDTVPTVRSNAVLCIEYFIGASPEWFKEKTPADREAYFIDALNWLRKKHGVENVISVSEHYDETSPHMSAYVAPIDPTGRLNAAYFLDGKQVLSAMQTEFAEKVGAKYGLDRGIEGSLAEHTSIQQYYSAVNAKTPEIKTKVEAVPLPTAQQRLAEAIGIKTDHTKALECQAEAQKKRSKEIREKRAIEQAKAKQYDLIIKNNNATNEAVSKMRESSAQLRKIPLDSVLKMLGAVQDSADRSNWKSPVGRITVTGEKFFNHDMSKGGGGAIDLMMMVEQTDYKGALEHLARGFGSVAALGHAAAELQPMLQRAAISPSPFQLPAQFEANWPRVRRYLTDTRRLGGDLIDGLYKLKAIYADKFYNAVFPFNGGGGAELRGTGSAPFHGIRGARGLWKITKSNETKVAFVESAIDAISLVQLGFPGGVCALAGNAGAIGRAAADGYRAKGFEVYAAFDNDSAGEAQAKAIGPAIRLKSTAKDWNQDVKDGLVLGPLPSISQLSDQSADRRTGQRQR